MEHWALIFFEKITLKHVWILLGTLLGIFGNLKIIFLKIFEDSTFHGKLGKNFRKISPKTCSKHVWILLGTLLVIFGILKIFFLKIFENSTLHGTLGKKFFEKFAPKHVQNMFETFGDNFGHFWNFEKKVFENF